MPVSKPASGTPLDMGNSLNTGVVVCIPFNEGTGTPAEITQSLTVTPAGSPTWTTNAEGDCVLLGLTGSYTLPGADTIPIPTGDCTIVLIRRKTDTTTRAATHFLAGTGGDPAKCCQTHLPLNNGNVYWDYGGQSGANRISTAWSATTSIEHWVFVAGSNGSALYLDGTSIASQGTGISRTQTSSGFVLGLDDLVELNFFMILAAQWTSGQAATWAADPYAIFTASGTSLTPTVGAEVLTGVAPDRVLGTLLTPVTP